MKVHLSNQQKINDAIKELANIDPNGEYSVEIKKLPKSRTSLQNRSLHLYLTQVADELNEKGLTVQMVLAEAIERHWDMETVKHQIWQPLQQAIFGNIKTSEMKTGAYGKVDLYFSHFLGSKFGIHVPWPVDKTKVKK